MADNLFSTFALVLLPMLASLIIISPYFPNSVVKIRRFAKGFAGLYLAYAALFLALLNPNATGFGFINELPFDIIPNLHLTLTFGVDNFSAIMCVLCAVITLIVLIVSKTEVNSKQKFYYALVLALMGATTGIFAANNLFTFFLFWQLELIPLYFLVSMWGTNSAKKSAERYVFAIFGASMAGLIGIGLICAYCADFKILADFQDLILNRPEFPLLMELIVLIGLSICFLVKIPVFPFHGAVCKAQAEALPPIGAYLSAMTVASGVYGLIRVNFQIFHKMFQIMAPFIIFLCALGALWCAFAAFRQAGIRQMLSFLSVSQAGIIAAASISFCEFGLNGAIFQILAHGLIFAGSFIGAGIIISKFKTEKIALLGGVARCMPQFAIFMLILTAAVACVPLTMGAWGNISNILGLFNSPLTDKPYFMSNLIEVSGVLAGVAYLITAVVIFRFYYKTFLGLSVKEGDTGTFTLSQHQVSILLIICGAIIVFGLYPMGILDKISTFSNVNIITIISEIF